MAYDNPDADLLDSFIDNPNPNDPVNKENIITDPQQDPNQVIDPQDPQNTIEDPKEDQEPEFDLIKEILKSKGITDPDNIKFQTETGVITTAFDDLSNEDKLQILNSSSAQEEDLILDQDEANIINIMRENDLTAEQLINYFKYLGAEEYKASQTQFNIDNYTDDELLALDLKSRFDDWTEEEILDEVERMKQNEAIYQKRVAKVKEDFQALAQKQLEEQQAQQASQSQQNQTQDSQQFMQAVKDAGKNYTNYSGIDLDQDDLNKAYDYLFKPLLNGKSKFAVDFSDPDKLMKLALLMTSGDEMFNNLHTTYLMEINKRDKEIDQLKSKLDPNYQSKNSQKSKTNKVTKAKQLEFFSNPDLELLLGLKD